MKVVVREAAASDLDDILDWISRDNPRAAAELVRHILARIDRLAIPGLSHIGRPGLVEGTRELIEPPYIVVCMIDEQADEIAVLAIVHGAKDREA
ncbi:MAG: type II toxin-antitoxin system RelE/ParE family toxin [Alphaproteobacteria bacterium]|nr:MAG: type II toxin-antitoxin system RelE/ParE family toxin [Alphaproteobacteria bacterium]